MVIMKCWGSSIDIADISSHPRPTHPYRVSCQGERQWPEWMGNTAYITYMDRKWVVESKYVYSLKILIERRKVRWQYSDGDTFFYQDRY